MFFVGIKARKFVAPTNHPIKMTSFGAHCREQLIHSAINYWSINSEICHSIQFSTENGEKLACYLLYLQPWPTPNLSIVMAVQPLAHWVCHVIIWRCGTKVLWLSSKSSANEVIVKRTGKLGYSSSITVWLVYQNLTTNNILQTFYLLASITTSSLVLVCSPVTCAMKGLLTGLPRHSCNWQVLGK